MAKIIIPENGTRSEIVIYSKFIESFNAFVETPLEDADLGEPQELSKVIPGHTRRKGPSDRTPINVSQSNASWLKDPTLRSGNALPGITFMLKTDLSMADTDMQRQFTLVGRTIDFVTHFSGKMKYQTFYYPRNGGRHTLLSVPVGEG